MARYELIRPVPKPSLMQRMGQAIRSITLSGLNPKDPTIRKYFGGAETTTGVSVSEYTAMNYSAVWSAVNLIAGDVAALPLVLYKSEGDRKSRYTAHPLYRILHDSPNPEMSSLTFRQTLQAHALTWGNGYAEIERDGAGRPVHLWPITPERVSPFRDGDVLMYRVSTDSGTDVVMDPRNMLHVRGLGFDGVQGYGVISKARESVALGIAAEKFGGSFYGNGSTFGGVLTHPARFATPDARKNFEASLKNRHQGVSRAHGLLLLEEGITYQQMGIPPDQAQFLESRQFQITEIARWFNVPPHKIGDLSRATFSNIEQQNIEYFQTTLIHWLETWEQELMRKLISPLERNQQFIEHVVEGLLRGDSQGRAALQAAEFNIGALTPNESRALSNRDPVPGGDRAFVQMNMMPLDRLDEYIDAQIASLKPPPAPPASSGERDRDIVIEIRALTATVQEVRAELAEAHKANAELVDDLTAAKVGQEALRAEVAAEKGLRGATEARIEALTEQLAVNASLLKDADERLQIARSAVEDNAAAVASSEAYGRTWHGRAEALAAEKDELENQMLAAVSARDLMATQRDEARTAQAHLSELLDGAQAALAAEQAERAAEAARLTAERDSAKGEVAIWTADWEEEHRKWDAASSVVADLTAKLAEKDAALTQEQAQHERDKADYAGVVEHYETRLADALKQFDDLRERATEAVAERDAAMSKVAALAEDVASKDAALAEHAKRCDQLRDAKIAAELAAADAAAAMLEADTAKLAAEARAEQAEQQHAIELEAFTKHQQDYAERVTNALTAQRAVIVDALGRMVRRETEKARRNQATPQKLRAWADAFYSLHRETCEEALEPAIRVHLALAGSAADPAEVTKAIVREHIGESQRQLRAVVDGEPDELHQTLERVLTRWESERPGALGDRLLKEGVAYVRSIR